MGSIFYTYQLKKSFIKAPFNHAFQQNFKNQYRKENQSIELYTLED